MTIDSDYASESFAPNGPQTYLITFENLGAGDISVFERDAIGTETPISSGNYTITVSGPGPIYDGATLQFLVPHLPDTVAIDTTRVTDITQLVDYQRYGPFPAETHEFALDKITMILQELSAAGGGDSGGGGISNLYIPLLGTDSGRPITGQLLFEGDGGIVGGWTLDQGNLFGINAVVWTANSINAQYFITTKDAQGNDNQFVFTEDGQLSIPSFTPGNNESWIIQGSDFLGAENAMGIYSFDNNTDLMTANPIILYTSPDDFFFHSEEGKLITTGVIVGGDDGQTLVTKIYVDGVVSGIGGLPADAATDVLVGTGAGWVVAANIKLDVTTDPAQANILLTGNLSHVNTAVGHEGEIWESSSGDILGLNTLGWAPDSVEGSFIIWTNAAKTDAFTFSNGYLVLADALPTSDAHAASKKYVDDRLPAGGTTDDTMRWNGTDWVANSNLTVDVAGVVAMSQNLGVAGAIAAGNLTPLQSILKSDDFGTIVPSDYLETQMVNTLDVQTIGGAKTFTDAAIFDLTVSITSGLYPALGPVAGNPTHTLVGQDGTGLLTDSGYSASDFSQLSANNTYSGSQTFQQIQVLGGFYPTLFILAGNADDILLGQSAIDGVVTNSGFTPNDFVQTTGTQTVGGEKTFSDTLISFGNIQASGSMAAGSLLAPGPVYSAAFGTLTNTNPSDRRLKKNIQDLHYGLEDLMELQPRSYEWKDSEASSRTQIGFIAQELEEVMPEAVQFDEVEEIYSINDPMPLIAMLVKSVQELTARLDAAGL